MLCAIGLALNENKLKTMAERIIALTRAYNIREGLSRKDDYLQIASPKD